MSAYPLRYLNVFSKKKHSKFEISQRMRIPYELPKSKRSIHIGDTVLLTKSPFDFKGNEKKTKFFSENASGGSSTGIEKDPRSIKTKKPHEKPQYKPEKWMLTGQEPSFRNQLNLAIVGHVDSGKSTLCSRLLHLQEEAKNKQKGLFAYACSDERERGVTMMVSLKFFDSINYHVVLLDSPGHKDFVPNLISGAAQADAAILVIDASIGACEAGMGQTKEHAQIVRSFGLEHIIVAINKLDSEEYSKRMFDSIKFQLDPFLRSCGFKESALKWIPLSAMQNQNLIAPASDARLSSWYNGGCLLDAIDSIPTPSRDICKPLILPVCDIPSSRTLGQLVVSGKLETGAIGVDSKVIVMPPGTTGTARTIEKNGANCNVARAGDIVFVGLQNIEAHELTSGGTLCQVDFPVQVASILELKILVLEIRTPILVGTQVKLDREVCVEEYATCRALGRVFLRLSGSTIAVGIVNRIIE